MSESADILASLGWDRVPSPCACCGEWGTDSTVNGWPVHARCWIGDNAAWLAVARAFGIRQIRPYRRPKCAE